MGDHLTKKDAKVSVELGQKHKAALFELLYFSVRCPACQANVAMANGPLENLRHAELIRALGVDTFEDKSANEKARLLQVTEPVDAHEISLELGRHLQGQLDAKARYVAPVHILNEVIEQLAGKLPKRAADMDEERTGTKSELAQYTFQVSTKERLAIFRVFNNPAICTACARITDGPDKRDKVALHSAVYGALKLDWFNGLMVTTANEQIDVEAAAGESSWASYTLDKDQADYLYELLGRRMGFLGSISLVLSRVLGLLDEVKAGKRTADSKPSNGVGKAELPPEHVVPAVPAA